MTRILPRAEYHRLAAVDPSVEWDRLPLGARVLVVERAAAILGHWIYLPVAHAEALWKQAGAGAGVSRRLVEGMRRLVRAEGAQGVWASATSDLTRGLLAHIGAVPVAGDHYMVKL